MKKILLILATGSLLFLIACGGSQTATDEATQEEITQLENATQVIEESVENLDSSMNDLDAALDSLDILFPAEEEQN